MLNHLLIFDYIKTMIAGIQPFFRKRVNYLPIQCNNTRPTCTKHFMGIYGKTWKGTLTLNLHSLDCILFSHYHAEHWIDFKPDPFLYMSHSDDGVKG